MKKTNAKSAMRGNSKRNEVSNDGEAPDFDLSSLGSVRSGAHLQALEPRILLDAAGFATGAEMADMAAAEQVDKIVDDVLAGKLHAPWVGERTADQKALFDAISGSSERDAISGSSERQEIVFIDSMVDDRNTLIAGFGAETEIYILDAGADGVEQMASVLEGRSGLDAVHIISHGRSGTLDLGSTKLTEASMASRHADEMAIIRDSLSESADILIYGCDFGANARGASAVEALAKATGADIAASEDLTGNTPLGGDWDLEVETGKIESTAIENAEFSGVLTSLTGGDLTGANTAGLGTATATITVPSSGPGDPGNTITIQRTDGGTLANDGGAGIGLRRRVRPLRPKHIN